ncbi:abscission/NoCut checkpoint regulator-like [Haliotis rufescens]|uniref:abscission/NoCut checkpoint regulator-like n=1 Tax=Haliotis rufescens TaxID=6454 RepID=UPI001EB04BB7|nr:abscission/NoCut checkpoint regulator-like [Haliotis rufescens]
MASGQCYGCGTTFGIFRKEHGCKNCGFAFCSRCLPKSIEVPKLNNVKHHVCNRCHEILTGKADREKEKEREKQLAAPDAYYKRLAALHEGPSGGANYNYGMSYSYTPTAIKAIPPQYRGLSRVDCDIAMRLEKLKEKPLNQPVYSDRDITDRLSKLKGARMNPSAAAVAKKPYYHPPDRRPQQQQVDELLNEIADEVEIDAKCDPAKDVEDRLVRFKDEPPRKGAGDRKSSACNNLNSETSGPHKPYTKNIRTATGGRSSRELSLDDVNNLISAMATEMELDAQKAVDGLQKDKEIMERLNELKKKRNAKGETSEEDNEHYEDSDDEEFAAKKIIKQYLEEVRLEERLGDIPSIDGQPTDEQLKKMNTAKPKKASNMNKEMKTGDEEGFDPDELPYCCICTNNATIRCLGCDFDLYCAGCFKEGHDKFDLVHHVTVKYMPPKGS